MNSAEGEMAGPVFEADARFGGGRWAAVDGEVDSGAQLADATGGDPEAEFDDDHDGGGAGAAGGVHRGVDDHSRPGPARTSAGERAPGPGAAPRGAACACADQQLAAWIVAIAARDERALSALYDATLSRVYALVLRIVQRPALAEEVVEDAYFQVWRQAARFDAARGRASTWVLGMARSRAIDALRREARFVHEGIVPGTEAEPEAAGLVGDELLDEARRCNDLHRALLLLEAQPRQLVALSFFRGLTHEEIADQMALPLGTVKSQIRRALITLRHALGDPGLSPVAG